MADQVQDFDEEYSLVQIEDHPLHGMFEVEVPAGWDDAQVGEYVEGLDLDLVLGLPPEEQDKGELNVDKIKEWENSVGAGLRGGKWYSHASLEGGTDTIAYGHKLTDTEAESGFIDINGKAVDFRKGLTQEQAQDLLNQDASWAKDVALASLAKVGMTGDEGKVQALTSLIYNVGSGAWGKSKAKKFLEAGQMEDFMHEAFSEEVGFVKVNGEKSRGLVRRRGAEAALFASANIDEGSSFGDMMAEVLKTINPISSAAAAEITPQQAEQQMALQKANSVLDKLNTDRPFIDVDAINEELSQFKEGAEGFKGTISGRVLAEIGKALMLPGNVATGRVTPTVENTTDAAGAIFGAGSLGAAPRGALRMSSSINEFGNPSLLHRLAPEGVVKNGVSVIPTEEQSVIGEAGPGPRKPEPPRSVIAEAGPGPRKPKTVEVQGRVLVADEIQDGIAKGIIPAEFRAFASDILGTDDGQVRDASYFSDDELNTLKGVVRSAHKRLGGNKGDVDYDLDLGGQGSVSGGAWNIFSGGELDSIKKTLGDFEWRIEDGRVKVYDAYDFNSALPKDTPWYERIAHVAKWGAAMATNKTGLYGFIRKGIGDAYGSRPGEGAAFVIDLGTVEEVLGSEQGE